MKKLGFTLAEVLIVLGIIGVISALTLPNVMADHKKKTFATQVQRFYNQLNNAVTKYKYEQGIDDLSESDMNTLDGVKTFVQNNFRVSKECGSEDTLVSRIDGSTDNITYKRANCFAETYTSIDKTKKTSINSLTDTSKNKYCVVLDTGASVCFSLLGGSVATNSDGGTTSQLQIALDVNGSAGPNMGGRDYFNFSLYGDGVIAGHYQLSQRQTTCKFEGSTEYFDLNTSSCFDTLMGNNWVMDY